MANCKNNLHFFVPPRRCCELGGLESGLGLTCMYGVLWGATKTPAFPARTLPLFIPGAARKLA